MKVFKRILLAIAVMLISATFVFASAKATKALKAYEEAVVAMEKAAEKNNLSSLMKAQETALKASEALDKVKDELSDDELLTLTKLTTRYAKAANKVMSNTLDSADAMLDGLSGLGL